MPRRSSRAALAADPDALPAPTLVPVERDSAPRYAPVVSIGPRTRIKRTADAERRRRARSDPRSFLWYGDNLKVLREHVLDESVDLVYLDPPFNSNRAYNVLFRGADGAESAAQIQAFDDTWSWNDATFEAYRDLLRTATGRVGDLIRALVDALGETDVTAYLVMMTPRLVELQRVMKPTASLYLHCDPTASHYLKIVLDAIFGPANFRNEVVWKRSHAHSDGRQGARHFGRTTDTILFYTKGDHFTWNTQYVPYDQDYIDRDYRRVDADGRRYRIDNLQGPGGAAKGNPYYEVMGVWRHWRYTKEKMEELVRQGRVIQTRPGAVPQYKRYLDEMPGVPVQNLWSDLPVLNNRSKESLGYSTQKPLALLERIIATSSNPGDVVLDPFCGCGTAVAGAEKLGRRWLGIDVTSLAIGIIENRMDDLFEAADFAVMGLPEDLRDAEDLADRDAYQFQWWAAGRIGAQPRDGRKKGADQGIDGILTFFDEPHGRAKTCIVSVKSGRHVGPDDVRSLIGTVVNRKAEAGVLITLHDPTPAMKAEARAANVYYSPLGRDYQKIQILTAEQILRNELPDLPLQEGQRRRIRRIAAQRVEQQRLPNWE